MSLGGELETNMTRRNWKSYVLELVIYWSCTGGFDGSDSDMGGGGGGGVYRSSRAHSVHVGYILILTELGLCLCWSWCWWRYNQWTRPPQGDCVDIRILIVCTSITFVNETCSFTQVTAESSVVNIHNSLSDIVHYGNAWLLRSFFGAGYLP